MTTLELKVRSRGGARRITVDNPALVGNDPRCDVAVVPEGRSEMGLLLWVLSWDGKKARLTDALGGSPIPRAAEALQSLGILGVAGSRTRAFRRGGKGLGIPILGALGCVVAFLAAGMIGASAQDDASSVPQPLVFGEPVKREFHADAHASPEGTRESFPAGVTFSTDIPPEAESAKTKLAFRIRGVAAKGDFAATVDGVEIIATELPEACLARPCSLEIPLREGVMKPGKRIVRFANHAGRGNFALAGVRLGPFPRATEEEKAKFEELVASAAEYLGNREVAKVNIVRARLNMATALEIMDRVDVGAELSESAKELSDRITQALVAHASRLFLDIEAALRVGDFDSAESDAAELRKVFPDDTTPEGRQLETIDGYLKQRKRP